MNHYPDIISSIMHVVFNLIRKNLQLLCKHTCDSSIIWYLIIECLYYLLLISTKSRENQYFHTVVMWFTLWYLESAFKKHLYTFKFSGELGQHPHNLAHCELALHEQQLHKLNMAQCEFLLQAELWWQSHMLDWVSSQFHFSSDHLEMQQQWT